MYHDYAISGRSGHNTHHEESEVALHVAAEYLHAGLHAAIIFDRFFSHMAKDDSTGIQQQLEPITSELKTAHDPDRTKTLRREMSRLVAEAERISNQPPTIKKTA